MQRPNVSPIYTAKKLYRNFKNSLRGISVILTEHAFLLELLFGIAVVYVIVVEQGRLELKLLLSAAYVLLLALEMVNTAFEKLCDRITTQYDPAIRNVKDLGSAGVFTVLLLNIALMGILVWN